MSDCMNFPDNWREFLRDYSFKDSDEVYTNGSELIPVFRVEQLIEHLLAKQEPRVLTIEEVEDLPYGHVLIETDKSGSLRWLDALLFCKNANFSFDFITLEGRARLLGTEYNREWRCWSAKPTEEQRWAVPWTE